MIRCKELLNEYDVRGTYTCQIRWELDDCGNGYILQYVEIEDPLHILKNYERPYYEAWKISNGKVVYECNHSDGEYDDEFSNELGGMARISVQEDVQELMESTGHEKSFVSYRCKVYYVADGTEAFNEINDWKMNTVSMAGNMIRSSYSLNSKLDSEEFSREKRWEFARNH